MSSHHVIYMHVPFSVITPATTVMCKYIHTHQWCIHINEDYNEIQIGP